MKIQLLASLMIKGQHYPVNSVVTIDEKTAKYFIDNGKAILFKDTTLIDTIIESKNIKAPKNYTLDYIADKLGVENDMNVIRKEIHDIAKELNVNIVSLSIVDSYAVIEEELLK